MPLKPLNDQEDQDNQRANEIINSTVSDSLQAWRIKTLARLNPYMANDPQALLTMSSMNMPDSELFHQAGEIYGMTAANSLAKTLPLYTESYQRAIFSTLSPMQQQSLNSMGYEPPKRDLHTGGFWDSLGIVGQVVGIPFKGIGYVAGPVVKPVLKAMGPIGELPERAYRTVRQLDGIDQWIALGAAAASLVALPVTFGASSTLTAALTAWGVRGLAATAIGTVAGGTSSAIRHQSFTPFFEAWSNAKDGERLFTSSGRKKAEELLKNPTLQRFAEQLAIQSDGGLSLADLATEAIAVRGGADTNKQLQQIKNVAKLYADEGSAEYQQLFTLMVDVLKEPLFKEALRTLERSKISWGRDIVRVVNYMPGVELDPVTGPGRWLSGSIDGFMQLWLDPFNIVGGMYRGYAFARRGLPVVGEAGLWTHRLTELSQLPEVVRKWERVAEAVNAGDKELLARGAREYAPVFEHLMKHKADQNIATFTSDHVYQWLTGTDGIVQMSKGVGLVHGFKYNQLKGLNRTQAAINNATQNARDFLRGIADIGIETSNFKKLLTATAEFPEVQQLLIEHLASVDDTLVQNLVADGLDEQAARIVGVQVKGHDVRAVLGAEVDDVMKAYDREAYQRAQDYIQSKLANSTSAYKFGRTVGAMPGGNALRGLAALVDGVTTQVPRGAVSLVGDDSVEELSNLIELFRHANVPSYVRSAWKAALGEAAPGGARLAGWLSFLDSIATASGMRLTSEGNDLLNKYLERTAQRFSLDGNGSWTLFGQTREIPLGVFPDLDTAAKMAVPNLHEIRKAASQAKLLNALIGVPENTVFRAVQNNIWKPLTLLRLGFFIRNASEEVLATVMRYGTGAFLREMPVTRYGQHAQLARVENALDELALRAGARPVHPEFEYILRQRYDLPRYMRPVARAIDRLKDGQVWQQSLYDHLEFLRNNLERYSDWSLTMWTQGLAGPGSKLRSMALSPLAERAGITTRREAFERMGQKLLFGSDDSLRRMMIGGMNPTIMMRAAAYEQTFASQLLEKLGTTNLAAWHGIDDGPRMMRIIAGEDVNSPDLYLVNSYSERSLATRDNPIPEQQPFANAVLENVARPFDEPLVQDIYKPLVLHHDPAMQQLIPREGLQDVLSPIARLIDEETLRVNDLPPLAEWLQAGQTIEEYEALRRYKVLNDNILQLWGETNATIFDRGRFNAALERARITDKRLAELEAMYPPTKTGIDELREHPLVKWAKKRNAWISEIQRRFPGINQPSWKDLTDIYFGIDQEVLNAADDPWVNDLIDINGDSFQALRIVNPSHSVNQSYLDRVSKKMLNATEKQMVALADVADKLSQYDPVVNDYIRNILEHWRLDPELIPTKSILEPALPMRPPSPMVYRGMGNQMLTRIDDEGNLIFTPVYQDHWHARDAISFSFGRLQSMHYVGGSVGAGRVPGAYDIPVLFSFRLDDLLESSGLSIDDMTGAAYLATPLGESARDWEVVRLAPPGMPFATDPSMLGRGYESAEFALVTPPGNSADIDFVHEKLPLWKTIVEKERNVDGISGTATNQINNWKQNPLTFVIKELNKDNKFVMYSNDDILANFLRTISDEFVIDLSSMTTGIDIARFSHQTFGLVYSKVLPEFQSGVETPLVKAFNNVLKRYETELARLSNLQQNWRIGDIADQLGQSDNLNLALETFAEELIDSSIKALESAQKISPMLELKIPAGKWRGEFPHQVDFNDPFVLKVNQWSSEGDYFPFTESLDDVHSAMKQRAAIGVMDGKYDFSLSNSPKWHGVKPEETFFVVDTRGIKATREWNESYHSGDRLYRSVDDPRTPNVVQLAANRQTPIIFDNVEDAKAAANYLGQTMDRVPPIQVMDVRKDSQGLAQLHSMKVWSPNKTEPINVYGWRQRTAQEVSAGVDQELVPSGDTLYKEFPAIWNWLDNVSEEPQLGLVDQMIDETLSRLRPGVRTQITYKKWPLVGDVYRNNGGVMEKLSDGQLIRLDDELYMSPTPSAETKISPDDQRIGISSVASYKGNDEIMWSLASPTMIDHVETITGRRLYEAKEPIRIPFRQGKEVEIPQVERQLRVASKKHVQLTPEGDLPDAAIAMKYKPYKQTIGDKFSNFFNYFGKFIDSVSRKPLAFHAFMLAADRNEQLQRWLIETTPSEVQLKAIISGLESKNVLAYNRHLYDRVDEIGRIFAVINGERADDVAKWPLTHSVAYFRGLKENEIKTLSERWADIRDNISHAGQFSPDELPKHEKLWNDFVVALNGKEQFKDTTTHWNLRQWLDIQTMRFFDEGNGIRMFVDNLGARRPFKTVDEILQFVDEYHPSILKEGQINSRFGAGNFDIPSDITRINDSLDPIESAQLNLKMLLESHAYVLSSGQSEKITQEVIDSFIQQLRTAKELRDSVTATAHKYAAEHAIRDVMPFIDSHEIRSQYADYMRGFMPFWYAEENFLKRWGRILSEGGPLATLQRLERLRLTYMGLQTAGVVRTDPQGHDYFVYPGSELLAEAVNGVFNLAGMVLPFKAFDSDLSPHIKVLFQSPADQMLPGFQQDWGRPSVSPLITAPMAIVTSMFPEARSLDEALVGSDFAHRNWLDRIFPAPVSRVYQAISDVVDNEGLNPKNERVASAMLAALAHAQATGNGLPQNATAKQRDDFIRQIREHARIIIVSQALAGYLLPGPPTPLQLTDGSSIDWIFDKQITNPAEVLSASYYELIGNLGIEEGTIKYLELYPNGSVGDIINPLAYTVSKTTSESGAPLPSTRDGVEFYVTNQKVFDQFPEAGPWLLPQDDANDRGSYAYNQEIILGLRNKRSSEDFVNAMIYREGAQEYYKAQNQYESTYKSLREAGRDNRATELRDYWSWWSTQFKATHPLFTEELESGEARQRRKKTIDQMRMLLKDPLFPKADHFEALVSLQKSFDDYTIARSALGRDRSDAGQKRLAGLKVAFQQWADAFLSENPKLMSYWITVLEPEAGLD